jgi:hypothetical protein
MRTVAFPAQVHAARGIPVVVGGVAVRADPRETIRHRIEPDRALVRAPAADVLAERVVGAQMAQVQTASGQRLPVLKLQDQVAGSGVDPATAVRLTQAAGTENSTVTENARRRVEQTQRGTTYDTDHVFLSRSRTAKPRKPD